MSNVPAAEVIVITNPATPSASNNNQPNVKKVIKGPHFKPQRHSVKGRHPILKRGVR